MDGRAWVGTEFQGFWKSFSRMFGSIGLAVGNARGVRAGMGEINYQCLSPGEKRKVVTDCDHLQSLKFSPQLPNAFTEHGAIMAATVLNSPQAVSASLFVVRAFVKLREFLSANHQLAAKLNELERKLQDHDEQFVTLFDAIR